MKRARKYLAMLLATATVLSLFAALPIMVSAAENGWVYDGENWFFYSAKGKKTTGWLEDGEEKYYFNIDGTMHTGWLQVNGIWYYFQPDGKMVTGGPAFNDAWKTIDGVRCYFGIDGSLCIYGNTQYKDKWGWSLYYLDLYNREGGYTMNSRGAIKFIFDGKEVWVNCDGTVYKKPKPNVPSGGGGGSGGGVGADCKCEQPCPCNPCPGGCEQ